MPTSVGPAGAAGPASGSSSSSPVGAAAGVGGLVPLEGEPPEAGHEKVHGGDGESVRRRVVSDDGRDRRTMAVQRHPKALIGDHHRPVERRSVGVRDLDDERVQAYLRRRRIAAHDGEREDAPGARLGQVGLERIDRERARVALRTRPYPTRPSRPRRWSRRGSSTCKRERRPWRRGGRASTGTSSLAHFLTACTPRSRAASRGPCWPED